MSICDYFRRISLRKRFIYVFSTTTLITVLAVIILIESHLISMQQGTTDKLNHIHDKDIKTSTINNLEALLVSYEVILNSYANKVRQLATSYDLFINNQDWYTSNEPSNAPPNCSSFGPTYRNYSQPCMYFYNGNQYYPSHSFFDALLPTQLQYIQQIFQRINVIYYNTSTNNVTTIRTYPASPIKLRNLTQIQMLYSSLVPNYINMSSVYKDALNTSNTSLMALSTVIPSEDPNIQMIIQVEMFYDNIVTLSRNVLYFPGSIIMYCYYDPILTNNTVIVLSISQSTFNTSILQENAYQIIANDVSDITLNDVQYYACQINFVQSIPLDLSKFQSVLRHPDGNFYLIQLVRADNIDVPYDSMATYIRKQDFIIGVSFGFTSIIAFMTVVSFSFMASNGISSRLNKISKSLNSYLRGEDHNSITIKLKKLAAQNLLKRLVGNIIRLIRKIQENKTEFANKPSTYVYQYPQNDFDIDFLKRISSKSADLWPAIEKKLMMKYPPKMFLEPPDPRRKGVTG